MLAFEPTAAETLLTYLVNETRRAPDAAASRLSVFLPAEQRGPFAPLVVNESLLKAARLHSQDMLTNNFTGHGGSNGSSHGQRATLAGYANEYVAENVYGSNGPYPYADTPEVFVVDMNDGWFKSSGHRANMLTADWTEFGGGVAIRLTPTGATRGTELFGSYDAGPFLTGVVFHDSNANRRFNVAEGLGGITVTATGPTGTFSTSSLTAGGWALKVPAGQYIVSASGGSFAGTSSAAITVGTDNMEVDFISGRSNPWVDFAEYVNAAPVLSTAATPTLPPVVIGTTTPRGGTVGSLLGTAFSDVNPLASRGIAVTAATPGTASGAWQYSLDEGATWLALGSPSATVARLLRAQDLVRFVPTVGSAAGTANISYRGWDQTSGTVGSAVDASTAGGSSAFSTAIATATASAVVSNTAPVLAGSGGGTIAPVAEDSTAPTGTTVAQIMGTAFSDVDPGTPAGLAVTGITGDTNGTWSYSLDEGRTWSSVGSVSQATALPLRASDQLRFVPNANFNGTATVTYRSWDQSTCVAGVRVDLTAAGLVGGSGPCSTGSATATVSVTPVNDAPGYVAGRSSLRLKPLAANTSFNFVGTTISDLLGNSGSDVDASAVAGIAVIGLGSGGSYYWNTGGNSWTGGGVSPTFVTLLRGTDRLGFAPSSGFTGESTVTFRLWDQTTGLAGHNQANLSKPDQSTGGTTAFGTDILTARIFVGSAGTAPSASFGALVRATDGRTASSIPITFSRAVEGLDVGDFRLTCNGSPVSLAGATLTGSGTSFVLGNLEGATLATGDYVVTIVPAGSGITDTVGGRLAAGPSANFNVAAAPSPPTDIALSATTVAENSPVGTAVGTLSTTDVDAGSTFTYTLVAGTGSTDNASFTIVGNQLKTATSFNYEAKASYSIRVRSTDQTGLTTEKQFTVAVTNVNEAPTDIALSATSVAENAVIGTAVGTLSTTDVDAGSTFTYSLVAGTGSTDNASFTIVGNQLKTAASFNHEAKSSYSIRVRTSDQGSLTTEKQLTITVSNVNEAPNDIALSGTTVPENAAIGTIVGTLSTTDVDAGSTFTYSLVAGTGSTDNASFTIVGNQLKTAASFNYEAKASYSIRVRTSDQDSLTTEKQFTITVTNVNEAPTDIALSATSVADSSAVGTVVGILSTTDVDAGSTFTYTLVAGTGDADNASFSIVGNALQTAASFNATTKSSYSIRVRSFDQGSLTTEKQFTIGILDATPPTAQVTSSAAKLRAGETAAITFTLSSAATDFTAGDVTVGGGSLTNFRRNSATSYSATFTPTAGFTGPGTVSVAAAAFTNAVGIPNDAGSLTQAIVIDTARPATPTISRVGATIVVTGLEADATWRYSIDDGTTWQAGSGTLFGIPAVDSAPNQIQVTQTDKAGNTSLVSGLTSGVKVAVTPLSTRPFDPAVSQKDMRAQAMVDIATGTAVGLYTRYSVVNGKVNLYQAYLSKAGAGFNATIVRFAAGVGAVVKTVSAPSGKGLLEFNVVGSTLSLFLDGKLLTCVIDSSVAGPGTAGTYVAVGTSATQFSTSQLALINP
jgi:hypothetical protein